jgi:hypothetical protein
MTRPPMTDLHKQPRIHTDHDRAQDRLRRATLRTERFLAGLCRDCGTAPFGDNGYSCNPCRDRNRLNEADWTRKRYARRRAAGLCTVCGTPAAPYSSLCAPHADDRRNRHRAYVAAHHEQIKERKRTYDAAQKQYNRTHHICPQCRGRFGRPQTDHVLCDVCCLDKRLARQGRT